MGKAERKNQILESAARLFSARRFDEVLMDDIAQEAKVAKGTLYSYFPDKEELYFAVVFDGISKLNERLQARADMEASPEEKLKEIIYAIVSFFKQNRFFFRLMSVEDSKSETGKGVNRQRWFAERHKQMDAIETVLKNGVDEGAFEIEYVRTEARVLRGMVRSVLTCPEDGLNTDQMVDVILRIFLRGVKKTN